MNDANRIWTLGWPVVRKQERSKQMFFALQPFPGCERSSALRAADFRIWCKQVVDRDREVFGPSAVVIIYFPRHRPTGADPARVQAGLPRRDVLFTGRRGDASLIMIARSELLFCNQPFRAVI
jgi:hypothetical protein